MSDIEKLPEESNSQNDSSSEDSSSSMESNKV